MGSSSYELSDLLNLIVQERAEELLVTPGGPPVVILRGQTHPIEGPSVTVEGAEALLKAAATEEQMRELNLCGDVKFLFEFEGRAKLSFRATLSHGQIQFQVRNFDLASS